VGLTVLGLWGGQVYALHLAEQYVHATADQEWPIKWETLTFQRAAFADGHLLPIYGSSELYCCAEPYYATQVFAAEPTGWDGYAVGGLGTGDLLFFQTLADLGPTIRGRRLVISVSPPYFFSRAGIDPSYYAGNYSPEIAETFAFDAPISLGLREAGARRMLAYPDTIQGQPLLRLALAALADPTPPHLLEYALLVPAGRVEAWVLQLQDALSTVQLIQQHPELAHYQAPPPPKLDWLTLIDDGTKLAVQRSLDDPFGFPAGEYQRIRGEAPVQVYGALDVFCHDLSNQDGTLFPYPTQWESDVLGSAEWTDLDLELRALEELGARPLIWSLPLPGTFDNYTAIAPAARQGYYRKLAAVMAAHPDLAFVDWSGHDEDRYFLTDISAHFSPRGWLFADRALDLYWHGQTAAIPTALAAMEQHAPPAGPPPPSAAYCSLYTAEGG
jgi:D-alanine transfer protein